ncbi:hypothetical protein KI387_037968 [Taxus chinensis]|uniref:Uncharacterized protein n=1 Tax=Taxus chinensis TaxID=29808 RepID=A0AA38L749_TAXCH|nr:hypothetical protein KI387_037968 [Taxus chinensis]
MHPSTVPSPTKQALLQPQMAAPALCLVSDLQVKIQRLTVIRPEKMRERHSLFLSNIDQKHAAYVRKFVHIFSAHPGIQFDTIVYMISEAIRIVMTAYDFMGGRLAFNSVQTRFEIDCNGEGAPLDVCTSELSLEELGDVSYPNPAFTQLCLLSDYANRILEHEPLVSFQMTRFRCGGFALGTAINQCLMDGFAVQEFVKNITFILTKGEMALIPDADRTCFKPRNPLQINYDHLEFLPSSEIHQHTTNFSPLINRNKDLWCKKMALQNPSKKHVYRLFTLSGKMLEALKMKAEDGGVKHCTRFMAALAHLWRARTAAMGNINRDDFSTVQFAVDIRSSNVNQYYIIFQLAVLRSKVTPPLPREFAGNAAVTAYAKATAKELQEQPFFELVKRLQQGVERITDDYVRSAIDWLELHDGVPCVENGFIVTSWSNIMGFGDLELGGGIKSVYGGPLVSGYVDIVTFLGHPKDKGGIQISIALEPAPMAKFQKLIETVDGITI